MCILITSITSHSATPDHTDCTNESLHTSTRFESCLRASQLIALLPRLPLRDDTFQIGWQPQIPRMRRQIVRQLHEILSGSAHTPERERVAPGGRVSIAQARANKRGGLVLAKRVSVEGQVDGHHLCVGWEVEWFVCVHGFVWSADSDAHLDNSNCKLP